MEEDRSWMYRRTVPGAMGISKEASMGPMHERAIWDAWQKRASLRYKDLMYKVRNDGYQLNWMTIAQYTSLCNEWGSKAYKKRVEAAQQNQLQCPSKHTGGSRSFIECFLITFKFESSFMFVAGEDGRGLWTVGTICPTASVEERAKYQELKANVECTYIETGSPILIDEQLIFEDASGNNKGHVYNHYRGLPGR
ncbi:hypothetical protein M9H77_16777 [Catharanthus roseus]|uniref:Uncharacterized protein n=1 Tax=Catharanthus roseus TaxID=4058 RepID=A0ACC0B2Q3_CATRO|nr:hypothetical protein M9H77_16777 [Catharanthus roseus]